MKGNFMIADSRIEARERREKAEGAGRSFNRPGKKAQHPAQMRSGWAKPYQAVWQHRTKITMTGEPVPRKKRHPAFAGRRSEDAIPGGVMKLIYERKNEMQPQNQPAQQPPPVRLNFSTVMTAGEQIV